jgi:hypothetical protein
MLVSTASSTLWVSSSRGDFGAVLDEDEEPPQAAVATAPASTVAVSARF